MSFPKLDGFVMTEIIGSGSYSTVYKAFTKLGPRTAVAIKCIDKCKVKHCESAMDNLVSEIRLLKRLKHPHIVEMKDFTWDDKNIYIIMEYCNGGDLSKYIKRHGRLPEKQVKYFMQQVVSALKYLKEQDIMHMDLKPHNLLLNKSVQGWYTVKMADFGFAIPSICLNASARGSPLYMSPALVCGEKQDYKADLWSLGVTMFECLFGKAPLSAPTLQLLLENIKAQPPIKLPPNSAISSGCKQLLFGLLKYDPKERITFEELFNNQYLDLEHMPNDDNYQKALQSLHCAVAHDRAGQIDIALPLYLDSLQVIIPRETILNKGNNRDVQDKLHAYMDRAEQIKAILNNKNFIQDKKTTELENRRLTIEQNIPSTSQRHGTNTQNISNKIKEDRQPHKKIFFNDETSKINENNNDRCKIS